MDISHVGYRAACRGGPQDLAGEAGESHALEPTTMAAATGLSDSTIGRIWREHGLKPHVIDTYSSIERTPVR
jgi:hypothetical protein